MSDANPQYVGISLSAICEMLPRPQIMTGLFVELLQRHFADSRKIEQNKLRELIWQDNPATNILIESVWRWDPATTNKRPAVIVKRNGYRFQRVGIGDNRQQLQPADEAGHPSYWAPWLGSHTLFCIGGSGAQAEILGSEVQREMTQFAPVIRESLGLIRLEVSDVGPVSLLEEAQDNFAVPVNVAYAYAEAWMIRQEAPRLKTLSLSTILNF